MPRRFAFVLAVLAVLAVLGTPLRAQGEKSLAEAREAVARRDYPAAVELLKSAVRSLDPAKDGAALGEAWLELGLSYLKGLGKPEEALPAFLASAASAPDPATAWLWASVAAEKLGRTDEATAYRARAVAPPAPAAAPAPVAESSLAPAAETPTPAAEIPEQAAPAEKPDAVQHFFGAEAAEKRTPTKKERKKKAAETRAAPEAEGKKAPVDVDAVDYFFGEKKKEESEEERPRDEKPPAAVR